MKGINLVNFLYKGIIYENLYVPFNNVLFFVGTVTGAESAGGLTFRNRASYI
jgi:hypothetical protein